LRFHFSQSLYRLPFANSFCFILQRQTFLLSYQRPDLWENPEGGSFQRQKETDLIGSLMGPADREIRIVPL